MSASVGEVARPTLRVRGLLGQAEPILITGGRAMADYREAFVGIDVAKLRNAIAIADAGREGGLCCNVLNTVFVARRASDLSED